MSCVQAVRALSSLSLALESLMAPRRQLGLSDRHTEVTVRPGLELLYFQVNRVSIPICLKIGLACGATDSSRETDAPSAGRQIPNNDLFFRTKARHRCSTLELIEINRHGRPPIR